MKKAYTLKGLAPTYFPALTGIRALAALTVFVHHFYGQWFGKASSFAPILRESYLGLTMFFTLSGFLITRTYYDRFRTGEIGFFEYWIRRFARVYPAYFFLWAVKMAFTGLLVVGAGQVLANMTLTQSYFVSYAFSGIAPAWSLTCEEAFYFLAPLVYFVLYRRAVRSSQVSFASPGVGRLGLTLSVGCLALWGTGGLLLGRFDGFVATLHHMQVYNIFGRFPEFAIGVAGAFFIRAIPSRKLKGVLGYVVKDIGLLLFWVCFALCVLALLSLRKNYGTAYGVEAPVVLPVFWLAAAGTLGLIWSCVQNGTVTRLILGNPFVEYLGRISYIFYLVQDRFYSMHIHEWIGKYTPFDLRNPLVSFVALNICAAIIHETVEKPAHRFLIRRYLRGS